MPRRSKKYKVSKAEKEILVMLKEHDYEVKAQFRIPGIPYIYDFYLPKLNMIVEYNGNYWHCNPLLYKSGTMTRIPGMGNVLVDYVWDKDELKTKTAEKMGYVVRHVWEEDYKKQGWDAVAACISDEDFA